MSKQDVLTLTYEPDMLVVYRYEGGIRADFIPDDVRLAELAGSTVTVFDRDAEWGTRDVPKADVLRVGERVLAGGFETGNVLLREDGTAREMVDVVPDTESESGNVEVTYASGGADEHPYADFDPSSYANFVVIADVDA